MDDHYYRSPARQKTLKDRVSRMLKNPKKLLVLAGGLFLTLYVLFDNKGIVRRISLEVQRREMQEKVEEAKEETERLRAQIKALEGDKKTIEKIARERYGMARPGETVYRVKKD